VGTLAQQFQALKAFRHGLPPPVAQPAIVIMQICHGQDFPVNPRFQCQWRFHPTTL